MKDVLVTLALGAMAAVAGADVKTKEMDYKVGGAVYQGYLAWDDARAGKAPGVIVVHEWWGHNEHARNQARRLARDGYVAFALDLYGKGKVATHPDDAKAFVAEATRDASAMNARFDAAVAELKKSPAVDAAKIAAIGYCFGGAVVLGRARAGDDLDAVVSFHGSLDTPSPAAAGKVKARVLVLTGTDDPMIPKEAVEAFKKEMAAAGATFEVVELKGAKHSFTNPDADKAGMPGLAYSAAADAESWARLQALFKDVFPR